MSRIVSSPHGSHVPCARRASSLRRLARSVALLAGPCLALGCGSERDATAADTSDAADTGDTSAEDTAEPPVDVAPDVVDPCAGVDCSGLDGPCAVGMCTDGSCHALLRPDDSDCDDGDACTVSDTCQDGVCGGARKDCSELDDIAACAVGWCDPSDGACRTGPAANGRACADGESCRDGACLPIAAPGFPCDAPPIVRAPDPVPSWCGACEGGICTLGHDGPELGETYCSMPCLEDDDCTFPDGAEGSCVPVPHEVTDATGTRTESTPHCVRTCRQQACPGDSFCMAPSATFDIDVPFCIDARYDACNFGPVFSKCIWEGDTCQLGSGGHEAVGVCADAMGAAPLGTPCDMPGTGSATPCTSIFECDEPGWVCESGFCAPPFEARCSSMCFLGVCSEPCALDGDCPSDMFCAAAHLVVPGTGADIRYGVCMPGPGSKAACDTDADCADPERCGWFPAALGDERMCYLPPEPLAESGESCGDDLACTSGICLGPTHTCAGLCAGDDDCAADEVCDSLFLGGDSAPRVCLPKVSCERDADCSDGETCSAAVRADGSLRGVCGPAGDAFAPACLFAGECGPRCATRADCGPQETCRGVPARLIDPGSPFDPTDDALVRDRRCVAMRGSERPCTRDGDCGDGEVCGVSSDKAGDLVTRCVPAEDGAPAGASCGVDDHDACASRLCAAPLGAQRGSCAAPCSTGADCAPGEACGWVPTPLRPEQPVSACVAEVEALCESYRPAPRGSVTTEGFPVATGWALTTAEDGAKRLVPERAHSVTITLPEGRSWTFEVTTRDSYSPLEVPAGVRAFCYSWRLTAGEYESGLWFLGPRGVQYPYVTGCGITFYVADVDGPTSLWLDPALSEPFAPAYASLNDWKTQSNTTWDLASGDLVVQGAVLVVPPPFAEAP